jgi:hypothetical protein
MEDAGFDSCFRSRACTKRSKWWMALTLAVYYGLYTGGRSGRGDKAPGTARTGTSRSTRTTFGGSCSRSQGRCAHRPPPPPPTPWARSALKKRGKSGLPELQAMEQKQEEVGDRLLSQFMVPQAGPMKCALPAGADSLRTHVSLESVEPTSVPGQFKLKLVPEVGGRPICLRRIGNAGGR